MTTGDSHVGAARADRERVAANEFLLRLHDRLRSLADPGAILDESCRLLGEHLGAGRVHYVQFDDDARIYRIDHEWCAQGMPRLVGSGETAAFGAEFFAALKAMRTVVISDVREDPLTARAAPTYVAIRTLAAVAAPLVRGGELVGNLSVDDPEPRAWSPAEVALIAETGARTWAVFERALTATALQASESKYRALFESIDEGFCIIRMLFDPAGRPIDYLFLEANAAFEVHSGLTNSIGRKINDLVPGHEDRWKQIYGRVAVTGEPVRFNDHSPAMGRWFDVYAFRVGAPADLNVGVLFSDVTQRYLAEHALREADRRKDEFLAMLAHELRNPLAPAMNAIEVLRREPTLTTVGERSVDIARRQLAQMRRMLDDLLDASRVSRGVIELRRETVDAARLIGEAIESCSPTAMLKRQALRMRVPPQGVHIHADPVRVAQIVGNLIGNALKFTPEDGEIDVVLVDGDAEVTIQVSDTGVGLEATRLEQVFELFSRAEPVHGEELGGLGIGLAIVKRLARLHGGHAWAESDGLGRGSTFSVTLPKDPQRE